MRDDSSASLRTTQRERYRAAGRQSHLVGVNDRAVAVHAERVLVPKGALFEQVDLDKQ